MKIAGPGYPAGVRREPLRILLTNDDGVDSEGVRSLVKSLGSLAQLWLVAPASQRSATSHGITTRETLEVRELTLPGVRQAWSVGGLPADCVKLALIELIREPIDLVISGINEGSNLGTDTLYSGTVAAALEGAFMGRPALAISLAQEGGPWDFRPAAAICGELVGQWRDQQLQIPPMSMININVPSGSLADMKGYRATCLGIRRYRDSFHLQSEKDGIKQYLLKGDVIPNDCGAQQFGDRGKVGGQQMVDIDAVTEGYVSLAPISVDRTDFGLLAHLAKQL